MEQFVIPGWVWLNAGVLVAGAAYVAVRLSLGKSGPAVARARDLSATYRPLEVKKA
jgi:hypothetical protein